MKIKISNAITAALCAAVLSAASYSLGYADADTGGGTGYSSQGKIVFDNGTEDTADDVIFDASDFRLIDDMVTEGKTLPTSRNLARLQHRSAPYPTAPTPPQATSCPGKRRWSERTS